jgi:hypothetical protein
LGHDAAAWIGRGTAGGTLDEIVLIEVLEAVAPVSEISKGELPKGCVDSTAGSFGYGGLSRLCLYDATARMIRDCPLWEYVEVWAG